ncbi:O-acetylhomoserine aminocarboxypropyltransferase/cysteine synthase [Enterococcus cecorum]|uniref:O-acetylhomoserine aminocarboxypropyltransferase/cysteine synthase family protein n=1 Tax=Enterococcus cecorum TaxID=44008 RepID=UPI001FAD3488|nr:O-acetylhomoserine aminocarboxypropyltransferase/cysteine synthase family protein [Enterococcus cecorum]MCJ0553140.1 O-acetylhomoserine aminocarboxypropyltransferase/cysteine synthase [Enterococcus cecorum]MCJ0557121.1 O-acetylhomoserine aminocarboxypropyltransferase/cysteine synthase [Enterococcus cecorum]MCJ0561279.1 O-acetylhomoserine aminocarboxypropyltransferase/cysteine synthase [Enterococcus cecorum]
MPQRFETIQLHGGHTVDKETGSRAVPIYQTTSYVFENAQQAAARFALEEGGNIYTRITNPTTSILEERLALLEGGVGALATASGSSAISYAIQNIASSGDHVVSASTLYGGTYNLFANTLPEFGITTTFVNAENLDEVKAAIQENTKALFIESLGNPDINVLDVEALSQIAHEAGIPLIVDNTFATPYLFRPFEHGADITVYSTTKYIGGHGVSLGGAIVDSGNFDWTNGKFEKLVDPDPSYHGVSWTQAAGNAAYITRARTILLRDFGAAISPFNAWTLLLGIETLSLRMERHVENAQRIAEFLENHPKVAWVHYPTLKSSPYYDLAQKYFPKGTSSVFSFGLKAGKEVSQKLCGSTKIFSLLANVGDAKSLIIHPASTTHSQLNEEDLKVAGIQPETIRISVGIENVEDLIEDLTQALEQI